MRSADAGESPDAGEDGKPRDKAADPSNATKTYDKGNGYRERQAAISSS